MVRRCHGGEQGPMIVVHEFAALGKIGADDRPVAVGE